MNDSSTYGDAPMQPGTESGVLPGEADKGCVDVDGRRVHQGPGEVRDAQTEPPPARSVASVGSDRLEHRPGCLLNAWMEGDPVSDAFRKGLEEQSASMHEFKEPELVRLRREVGPAAQDRLRELAEAAEAVLVSHRPIIVGTLGNPHYNNPFYGPQIERLDKLVKEVLGDGK